MMTTFPWDCSQDGPAYWGGVQSYHVCNPITVILFDTTVTSLEDYCLWIIVLMVSWFVPNNEPFAHVATTTTFHIPHSATHLLPYNGCMLVLYHPPGGAPPTHTPPHSSSSRYLFLPFHWIYDVLVIGVT